MRNRQRGAGLASPVAIERLVWNRYQIQIGIDMSCFPRTGRIGSRHLQGMPQRLHAWRQSPAGLLDPRDQIQQTDVDVSFISLTKVLPALRALCAPHGRLVALVKPQFEVGPRGLDRHGIVRDAARYDEVRAAVTGCADDCGWQVHEIGRAHV